MLQTGDFCIIAVLNDARACYSVLSETMKKITGPLTSFQIRDLMAHINYISLNLKEMPVFHSTISYKGEYKIVAEVPDIVHLKEKENRIISHGELLHFYTENMLGNIEERDSILNDIRAGIRNYLFNEDGSFIDHSKI